MSQQELLIKVIQALEEAEIEYMVTGSIASSLQGEPRSTHDIDIVVAIQKSTVKSLVAKFSQPEYYLDEESLARRSRKCLNDLLCCGPNHGAIISRH
ncbi:MAG: nucleotidyltransferase domain-containing protein [bacterium]